MSQLLPLPKDVQEALARTPSITRRTLAVKAETSAEARRITKIPPENGVGTRFYELAAEIGLKPCWRCKFLMETMNRLGIAGCEKQFDWLVSELKTNAESISKTDYLLAVIGSIFTGLAWKVDRSDPIPGMLREAIRRQRDAPEND